MLSHELRGPIGVLQGYLRLMKTQPARQESDLKMIKGMLDATGRLADLGRQASELSTWLRREDEAADVVPAATLLADVRLRTASPAVVVSSAAASVRTPDRALLASAIAAVADGAARDTGDPSATMSLRVAPAAAPGTVAILIGPADAVTAARPAAPDAARLPLDKGGLGLMLVMASYVLDAHDASVVAAEGPAGVVEVRLPGDGAHA